MCARIKTIQIQWDEDKLSHSSMPNCPFALQMKALRNSRSSTQNASASFLNAIPFDYQFVSTSTATSTDAAYAANLLRTRKLETQWRHANERLDTILQEIAAMEVKMGITWRWEPSDSYHMRTHTAKALQTCCKAIQNKVKEYNAVASALVLPALSLDWSHVSHYGFLMSSHFSMKPGVLLLKGLMYNTCIVTTQLYRIRLLASP
ncbi:hypothetical protein F4604DRAFT_1674501 [Suillus subluteus]|nr:hypothetical protein F4604DRAFT_1674501 [Suillus subluteus]